ncbi:band 7 family-domain-containing protein [Pelagophyceae sp. CCMP2097]|nr:band 7 family-domain-containing protein [Pelagophyceae sp. CCMP2097]|mmetsp:Transcript_25651/g.86204  ORF Transcript_25651/g.86204 Transcript_25651/m.86204 type:complete len:278 (-) Transcript_25651:219-1052(-)
MERMLQGVARLGVGIAGATFIGGQCLYNVEGGHRAVIFDQIRGVLPKSVSEGTGIKIPVLQTPIIMDIRSRPREIKSVTGTKDLQMVNIYLRVLSRPDEDHLPTIYQTLGTNFDDRVLPSLGNEVLKSVVAQYNADQLLSMREQISRQIRETLTKRAGAFNLILDDVSITHLVFGKEFTNAIEQKQVAQQEAERQTYVVAKAEQEKKAAIIRAEGEATAAAIISKALDSCGNGLIEVRRIDAAREVAETLSRSRAVTYLPSGGNNGNQLLLNVNANQ